MYKVDPDALHLAQEFKAKPVGKHSAELQKLLNLFRGEAQTDKYVLVCTEPHRRCVRAMPRQPQRTTRRSWHSSRTTSRR